MASQVGMANRALTKLGSARITSLDEDSKSAAVLNSMYEDVLDVCLSEHIWAFAKARTELATLSPPPAYGFAGQFRLPTDYLRMLQVGQFVIYPKMDTRGLYSVEGGNILTDLPAPLRLRYIRRVTDPNAMHPLFREVFACRLAAESCEAITQSSTKKQAAWAEHDRAIAQAIRVNAAERPSQPIADDSWIESRQGAREWGASPIIRS